MDKSEQTYGKIILINMIFDMVTMIVASALLFRFQIISHPIFFLIFVYRKTTS